MGIVREIRKFFSTSDVTDPLPLLVACSCGHEKVHITTDHESWDNETTIRIRCRSCGRQISRGISSSGKADRAAKRVNRGLRNLIKDWNREVTQERELKERISEIVSDLRERSADLKVKVKGDNQW